MGFPLVIGYGNPLRGDDGLGPEVARRVGEIISGTALEILTPHQLAPELAEPVSRARLVIFVDARLGEIAGAWTSEEIKPADTLPPAITHHLTPPVLLAYARALYGACPRALAVSVVAASFECGEQLSPAVAAAVPDVVRFIGERVRRPAETV